MLPIIAGHSHTCHQIPATASNYFSKMSFNANEPIPKKARGAFVKQANNNVTMEDYDVVQAKDLKPGEALVKVMYSGVCHVSPIRHLHILPPDSPTHLVLSSDRLARRQGRLAPRIKRSPLWWSRRSWLCCRHRRTLEH